MADKLIVHQDSEGFRIVWELNDGDEIGAVIGADKAPIDILASDDEIRELKEPDDRLHWVAHKTLLNLLRNNPKWEGRLIMDRIGFNLVSQKWAEEALHLIEVEFQMFESSKKKYPEWARHALLAGWTPPEDWEP